MISVGRTDKKIQIAKTTHKKKTQIPKLSNIIANDIDDSDCESIDIENFSQSSPIIVDSESFSDSNSNSNISKDLKRSNKTPNILPQNNNNNNNNKKLQVRTSIKSDNKETSVIIKKQLTKNTKAKRVTLYLDDDPAKPITAGGVMIYKYVQNKMMLLIIETDGKYEDIGGKIDPIDDDIFCAVAREIQEETNNHILSNDIIERLKLAPYIYVPKSKYVIYLVEATNTEKKLKKSDFGDMEEHDAFPRTIGWISRDVLIKPQNVQYKLNWRLKSKALFDQLIEIEKTVKYKKKIFKGKSIKDDTNENDEETYTPGDDS
jgi:hypothetical protein